MDKEAKAAAVSLLADPIALSTDGTLINGQHRLAAMRDQRVPRVVMVISVHDDDLDMAAADPDVLLDVAPADAD